MEENKLRITRDQLAKFLPDQKAVRQFERLFQQTAEAIPSQLGVIFARLQDLQIDLSSADARAVMLAAMIARAAADLEVGTAPPGYVLPRSIDLDYLDFTLAPNFVAQQGRICWNTQDDTLNIHHSGGVVQQVGQELFGRIVNGTASPLANGAAIGLSASGAYVPFIANGTMPALNILGIASETIAPAALGRFTVWGVVNGIDTTGAAYGEAWAVGDILYVSTTVAGGLTRVKPTAPNFSIPIARVESVSATIGQLSVRPVPEQQRYYGQFVKTADQVPAAANTAYAVTWTATGIASGVSLTAGSRIGVANAGLYRFSASIQLTSSSSTVKNVWVWYRKNGVDIPNSALITSLDSGTAVRAPSRALLVSMSAGDYLELMFASDSTNVTIDAVPATAFAPAAPAALLSVSQEQN